MDKNRSIKIIAVGGVAAFLIAGAAFGADAVLRAPSPATTVVLAGDELGTPEPTDAAGPEATAEPTDAAETAEPTEAAETAEPTERPDPAETPEATHAPKAPTGTPEATDDDHGGESGHDGEDADDDHGGQSGHDGQGSDDDHGGDD